MHAAKIVALNALLGGAALAVATQAGAQPIPVDPALPPAPSVPAWAVPPAPQGAPAQPATPVFVYTPIAEGAGPAAPGGAGPAPVAPPAPPPVGAPYIPPVPNANFGNTGQMDFLRDLWNMRNNPEFMQTMGPGQMDPATWVPPAPYGTQPPPPVIAPGSPPPPASAPPPVWPPVPMPAPAP